MNVPVESSREPTGVVRGSKLMSLPVVRKLSVGLHVVRVGSAQGLLFCIQKSSPFLQSEELKENVCEIEPAGSLQ